MTKREKSAMLERVCDIAISEINEARMTIANGRKQLNYKDGSLQQLESMRKKIICEIAERYGCSEKILYRIITCT